VGDLVMLSYFNKLINIKRFVRRLKNGKEVVVDSHSRRAIVSRLREGLEDLRNTDIERGYVFRGKGGKLSKKVQGTNTRIEWSDLFKKKNPYELAIPKTDIAYLHNHPHNLSLSFTDFLATTTDRKKQVFAITPRGDVFRAKTNPSFIANAPIIESHYHSLLEKYKVIDNLDTFDDKDFVVVHTLNNLLKRDGHIFYRSKLTQESRNILENNQDLAGQIIKDWNQLKNKPIGRAYSEKPKGVIDLENEIRDSKEIIKEKIQNIRENKADEYERERIKLFLKKYKEARKKLREMKNT
jgi:hypothetical protein